MLDKIEPTLVWYKWILKFHPVKYLGIAIMVIGPLAGIFRYLFLHVQPLETILIGASSLVVGAVVWRMGWDPYH